MHTLVSIGRLHHTADSLTDESSEQGSADEQGRCGLDIRIAAHEHAWIAKLNQHQQSVLATRKETEVKRLITLRHEMAELTNDASDSVQYHTDRVSCSPMGCGQNLWRIRIYGPVIDI
jgi:hypothetical protein